MQGILRIVTIVDDRRGTFSHVGKTFKGD